MTQVWPPGVIGLTLLPDRKGGKGPQIILTKGELSADWEQTSIEDWEAAMMAFAPPARPDAAPDLIGAVFGFRAWHLDAAGYLTSHGMGRTTWEAGRNVAICVADISDGHRAPLANCGCGLYAYHDPNEVELMRFSGTFPIAGIVRAWGDIEVHEAGIRAEYAEIVALCEPVPEIVEQADTRFNPHSGFAAALKRYGVESIPCTPAAMREWVEAQPDGDVVPEEMRPEVDEIPAFFWSGDMEMTEDRRIRVNGQPRARAWGMDLKVLEKGEEPEPQKGRVMYVGEVLLPGHTSKRPAVVYLTLKWFDRTVLKHGNKVTNGLAAFCALWLACYVFALGEAMVAAVKGGAVDWFAFLFYPVMAFWMFVNIRRSCNLLRKRRRKS